MSGLKPEDEGTSAASGAEASPRSRSRGEFVYKELLKGIREGKFRPGDRIREEDIAQSLGVSRTPVREALQHLQARRLVETAAGRGIVVVELSIHQILELYAMREVLDGAAARFAAQHALPAELAMMRDLNEQFEAANGDTSALAEINKSLHRVIYEAARNRYMYEGLNNLEETLSLLKDTTFSLPERHEPATREHRAIVAAIESRDAEGAEAASRLHIREAQRARLRMLMNR